MMLSIWVLFMLGDSLVPGEAPAYEQVEVSRIAHDYAASSIEEDFRKEFAIKHPHHVVCESGWCKQKVQVWA